MVYNLYKIISLFNNPSLFLRKILIKILNENDYAEKVI